MKTYIVVQSAYDSVSFLGCAKIATQRALTVALVLPIEMSLEGKRTKSVFMKDRAIAR